MKCRGPLASPGEGVLHTRSTHITRDRSAPTSVRMFCMHINGRPPIRCDDAYIYGNCTARRAHSATDSADRLTMFSRRLISVFTRVRHQRRRRSPRPACIFVVYGKIVPLRDWPGVRARTLITSSAVGSFGHTTTVSCFVCVYGVWEFWYAYGWQYARVRCLVV